MSPSAPPPPLGALHHAAPVRRTAGSPQRDAPWTNPPRHSMGSTHSHAADRRFQYNPFIGGRFAPAIAASGAGHSHRPRPEGSEETAQYLRMAIPNECFF